MTVNVFPTAAEAAQALVERILQLMDEHPAADFNLALSGGSTPALMFDIWASKFLAETPWQRLYLYWVDERCVPPGDAESNYGMTHRHLLAKVPLAADHVFRIHGENDPEAEAVRYARLVAGQVPCKNGLPVFDLVLLGAGDDGHTSSIFPGQEALLNTEAAYAVGIHPQTGQQRVALTGRPIVAARHVAFLMAGSSKAPVLKAMRRSADAGPAAYVAHHAQTEAEVFADLLAGGK